MDRGHAGTGQLGGNNFANDISDVVLIRYESGSVDLRVRIVIRLFTRSKISLQDRWHVLTLPNMRIMKRVLPLLLAVFFLLTTNASAQAPNCGSKNDLAVYVPSNYTFTLGARDLSYLDPSFHCTVFRITNGPVEFGGSTGATHNYIMSPVNSDDTLIVTNHGAGAEIRSFPDGTILIPANDRSLNGLSDGNSGMVWEPLDAHKILFLGGSAQGTATQLMRYNIYKTSAVGTVNSGSSFITVASAAGIVGNASITIHGAGPQGALFSAKVGAGYAGGTRVPLTVSTSTTVTNPVVAIGYDTVQHDFNGTYKALDRGGHGSIASSTCCIGLVGQNSNGTWNLFAYDYVKDIAHVGAVLHGVNADGVTVNKTAAKGATSIVFSKTADSGMWLCATAQGGACQFTIAGDSTVYTFHQYTTTGSIKSGSSTLIVASCDGVSDGMLVDVAGAASEANLITTVRSAASCPTLDLAASASTSVTSVSTSFGPSCYSAGTYCTIKAGMTTALPFTPALTQTENSTSAVTLYHKPNDPRLIGNKYLAADTTVDASNTSYDLYDIDMIYLNTPTLNIGSGGVHNDQGIDPATGHPTIYMGTGNDTVPSGCGFNRNGIEKVDMITSKRKCLQTLTDFHQSGHFSLSNSGLWLAQEQADFEAHTACSASCLPANWASLWEYAYNEVEIINVDTGDIYRLAHHYSRVTGGPSYWAQPRVALSGDAAWVIFDSNFGQTTFIENNSNYANVYAIKTGIPVAPAPETWQTQRAGLNRFSVDKRFDISMMLIRGSYAKLGK